MDQLAEGLRRLSQHELKELDMLLHKKAGSLPSETLKASYVRKIRGRMKEPAPYEFTTPKAFLAQLHGK